MSVSTDPNIASGRQMATTAPPKLRFAANGNTPAVLADIFKENINIAIWERALPTTVNSVVTELVAAKSPINLAITLSRENALESICSSLGTSPRCALSRDIALLVDMFCDLLGLNRAALRVRTLDQAMCPKFHVDRVPCRLITTYYGAGTEWLPHDAVNRSKLGTGSGGLPDTKSGLIKSVDDIEQFSRGDVGLLKGELWQNNRDAGLVHRSPDVITEDVRVLVSIDVSN
ncbi:MAG: DUF1826 domain-containing protein [Pseudomonadota bacterium]